jgi:carboxyl-terminal processing protease
MRIHARSAAVAIAACALALAAILPSSGQGLPLVSIHSSPLVIQALDILQHQYVDPIDPARLANAAIAALRDAARLSPDDLPPVPPGSSLQEIERAYSDRLSRAASSSGRPRAELDQLATAAMLESLRDSHTHYMPPDAYEEEEAELNGQASYAGIGIRLGQAPGQDGARWIFAADVFPGSPADLAGIRRFDRIVAADGHSLRNADIGAASSLIRGKPGSSLTLTMARGSRSFTVTITRAAITVPPATVLPLPGGILWAQLRGFTTGSARALEQALRSAAPPAGLRGIILDLRGNPGGLISEAERVAGLFLPGGLPIATLKDRDSAETLRATGRAPFLDTPLAVLIDAESASASEIVASALKDSGRAILVGDRSAGALGAAITVPLSSGAVSITVARILGAKGETIDGVGIPPDIASALAPQDIWRARDTQLEDALHALRTRAPSAAVMAP